MNESDYPRLHLREPLDGYRAFEISAKGWYNGAVAELPGGALYPVLFYSPTRLSQELESAVERGDPCLDVEAIIVVPDITEAAIRALKYLFVRGWFDRLVPSRAETPSEALRLVGAA